MADGCPPPPNPLPPPTGVVVIHASPTGKESKNQLENSQQVHGTTENPASPLHQKISYRDIAMGGSVTAAKGKATAEGAGYMEEGEDEVQRHALKPTDRKEGKPAIRFNVADKEKYMEKLSFVLIGKFSHGRPQLGSIKEFFLKLKLKGAYNLSLFDAKHLFIECANKEDFVRIWMRITWYIQGFPMRIFKWSSDFAPGKESSVTPAWIHLPALPLYLYENEAVLSIANAVGAPLKIGTQTAKRINLGCASVCVELDVAKPLADKVWIGFEEEDGKVVEGFWQRVVYDQTPQYCKSCNHSGHQQEHCKRMMMKGNQAEKHVTEDQVPIREVNGTTQPQSTHPGEGESQNVGKGLLQQGTRVWVEKTFKGEHKITERGGKGLTEAVPVSNAFSSLFQTMELPTIVTVGSGEETTEPPVVTVAPTGEPQAPPSSLGASTGSPYGQLPIGTGEVQTMECINLPLKAATAPNSPVASNTRGRAKRGKLTKSKENSKEGGEGPAFLHE